VILFKNRRGYAPYKICSICGWMPECKHCNVALTYHKNKNHLICHYCNTVYTSMNTCPVCAGQKFEQKNFGTEKVEEAVSELFPEAKLARMDLDSVKGKNAHSNLIRQFELGTIDILIGTQMLVKGLDFEDVHLVCILDADSLLHFADFRVHERAFQLMEQVSGRAGRKNKQGKVLIQAMQNEHPLLQFIKNHDYEAFYNQEIKERKEFHYPPFTRLIQIQFKNKDTEKLLKAATYFAKNIPAAFQKYMIGPAEPFVNKIRNQFIMELLFKLPKDTATINACKTAILKQFAILQNTREFSSVVVIPNVDPV
jgi:primosomal protein N' (replication factor Y) (superfamily II helicase)